MPILIDPQTVVKLKTRIVVNEDGRYRATQYAATTADNQVTTLDHPTFRYLFDAILELGRNLMPVDLMGDGRTWKVCDG